MTVKELIEELSKYPPERRVVVDDCEIGFITVEMVTEGNTNRSVIAAEPEEVVVLN